MISIKSAQSVLVFSAQGICLALFRNPDGSICQMDGSSAVPTLTAIGKTLDAEYASVRNDVKIMTDAFNALDDLCKVTGIDSPEMARTMAKQAIEKASSVSRDLYVAASEVRELIALAKKHDRTEERIKQHTAQTQQKPAEATEIPKDFAGFMEFLSGKLGLPQDTSGEFKLTNLGPRGGEEMDQGCGECDACKQAAGEMPEGLSQVFKALEEKLGAKITVIGSPEDLKNLNLRNMH